MAVKKTVKKKAANTKKAKVSARKSVKKAAPKKKAAAPKKKTTARKKAAPKKKAVVKKSVPKKKTAVKKASPKKKAAARKKTATSKKSVVARQKPAAKSKKARLIPDEPVVGMSLPIEGVDPYQPAPGEIYMSDEQYAHFRLILIEWKKQLMQEVDRTVNHMKSDAANYADPADRATQEEEFSLELRTRDRERKLIKKIDESLASIDSGDYGYCQSCGIEIGIRRLEARPTATQCIDCKTLQEIKEKQIYS